VGESGRPVGHSAEACKRGPCPLSPPVSKLSGDKYLLCSKIRTNKVFWAYTKTSGNADKGTSGHTISARSVDDTIMNLL
jgi:hypothetical protein